MDMDENVDRDTFMGVKLEEAAAIHKVESCQRSKKYFMVTYALCNLAMFVSQICFIRLNNMESKIMITIFGCLLYVMDFIMMLKIHWVISRFAALLNSDGDKFTENYRKAVIFVICILILARAFCNDIFTQGSEFCAIVYGNHFSKLAGDDDDTVSI